MAARRRTSPDGEPAVVRQEAHATGHGRIYMPGRDLNFHLKAPRSLVVIVAVAAVLAGGYWAGVTWVLPWLAPTYKTHFLIDATADTAAGGPGVIAASLKQVLANSGDGDALALRSFGGECGADGNTKQLVGFGTGNRQEIAEAAAGVPGGGQATLLKGLVQAVEDFSAPLSLRAKQVNRVIVVTRHGTDACDTDTAFVEREIRQRIAGAGLAVEFRLIGFQVPEGEREGLSRLATASGAPAPLFADTPARLRAGLDWYANVEPVIRGADQLIRVLNRPIDQVNAAYRALEAGRIDAAERTLDQAEKPGPGAELEDLRGRAKTPAAQDIYRRAAGLRVRQGHVIAAAERLLGAARSGSPPDFAAYIQVADTYNDEVDALERALKALRATSPAAPR
ncbi:hypothetical protein [Nonomuraea sp. NPDC050691]|uniref:hypothetical protein n=1 Tax=Nonomuraea sp. NPDC050691 TaxID=3155661 RepID=UPI0033D29A76